MRLFTFRQLLLLSLSVSCLYLRNSSAQTTIPNIDDKKANTWQWCNTCAEYPPNTYALGGVANVTQSGYTVDGSSVRFDLIKNGCCYGNVFFWNVLTKNISAFQKPFRRME